MSTPLEQTTRKQFLFYCFVSLRKKWYSSWSFSFLAASGCRVFIEKLSLESFYPLFFKYCSTSGLWLCTAKHLCCSIHFILKNARKLSTGCSGTCLKSQHTWEVSYRGVWATWHPVHKRKEIVTSRNRIKQNLKFPIIIFSSNSPYWFEVPSLLHTKFP